MRKIVFHYSPWRMIIELNAYTSIQIGIFHIGWPSLGIMGTHLRAPLQPQDGGSIKEALKRHKYHGSMVPYCSMVQYGVCGLSIIKFKASSVSIWENLFWLLTKINQICSF